MRKLSDSELATRTRDANRRRSERARERLTIAGRAALTVWLPVGLRRDFVAEAAACGVNISELATRLIEKGLRDGNINRDLYLPDPDGNMQRAAYLPDPETADLFAMADSEYRVRPDNECPVCGEADGNPHLPDCDYRKPPYPQTPVVVADTASTPPPVSVNSDRDAMMTLVAQLLADGLTGADIARKLTAAGYRSQQGTELRGANVLREYRAWKEKTDAEK